MILNIITPCTRVDNLPLLRNSILEAKKDILVEINWYIVVDGPKISLNVLTDDHIKIISQYITVPHSISGNGQRNRALDQIEEGIVCFLDDDNLLHPRFIKKLSDLVVLKGSRIGMVCKQELSPGRIRAIRVKKGKIDAAQFAADIRMIGRCRWRLNDYSADGEFIEAIYQSEPENFVSIQEVLSYYNKLNQ